MNQDILQEKKDTVEEIVDECKSNKTLLVAEYRGLTVAQLQELRRALREQNSFLSIYKNTLVTRAFDKLNYSDGKELLSGPNSFIFSEDELSGIKVATKYSKRFAGKLVIKGAIVEGEYVDKDTVKELSKLGSKDSLYSMFLSCLNAPISKFAATVQAIADNAK
ncbi:MAG: 50S ribosomal protein L10 [Coprobacillus sp.]|nr:50S ribosomal protein L10 [Coprobacillus sp.]